MKDRLKEVSTERQNQIDLAIERLREINPNQILTYEELSDYVGESIRPGECGYSIQLRARWLCCTEFGLVFDCVPNTGFILRSDRQIATHEPGKMVGAVRRRVRKSQKRMGSVQSDAKLTPFERSNLNMGRLIAHNLLDQTSGKSVKNARMMGANPDKPMIDPQTIK